MFFSKKSNKIKTDAESKETKKCLHCLRRVSIDNEKCPHCKRKDFQFDN